MSPYLRKRKRIDYQKALLNLTHSMVRLKQPERLLKMITRFINREFNLSHTSLVIWEEERNRFIFADSRGSQRFPVRLIRFDPDHPMVRWFHEKHSGRRRPPGPLDRFQVERWLANGRLKMAVAERREKFEKVRRAMSDLKIELAVPGYHKKSLVGILLLGGRNDRKTFSASEISFFQILTLDCAMAVKQADYHKRLLEKNQELEIRVREIESLGKKEHDTYYEIMRSLAQEVHAKDPYTFGHVHQVERLGIMTAQEMGLDLSGRKRDVLSASLILHDVGKIGIPDNILKKPAGLTDEERKIMRTHVEKGARILEHLTAFKDVAEVIRCHHENYDGSGYPRGISGGQIPVEARIVSVVDAFHAIVSKRCYSQGRSVEAAFEELRRCSGTQFDPRVVEAFIHALQH